MPLYDVDDELFPCIAHGAQIRHLDSIINNGLAPDGDRVTQAYATHELASSSQKALQALKDNTKAKNLDFTFKQTLTGLAIPQDNFAKELSSPSDFWPASPTYKNYLVFFNKKGILNKCVYLILEI